jgi:hypothetical protein
MKEENKGINIKKARKEEGIQELRRTFDVLFPEKDQRDFVNLFTRLTTDDKFKAKFWNNPAESLKEAKLEVDPRIVETFQKSDKTVIDKMVSESRDLITKSSGFTYEGEVVAAVPLIAAFLAGALAMRLYDDRWVAPRDQYS